MCDQEIYGKYKVIEENRTLRAVEVEDTTAVEYGGIDCSKKISNLEAGIQLTKVMLGTGILFMPKAFRMVGLWQGIVATIIIAILTMLTYQLLIRASQNLGSSQSFSYSYTQTAHETFKRWPAMQSYSSFLSGTISAMIVLSCYSVAIVYVIMIAKNIEQNLRLMNWEISERVAIALQLPFHLCANSFKSMKRITAMSVIALIVLWIGYFLTTYIIFTDLSTHGPKTIINWTSITELPIFLSIVVLAFSGITAVTAIENNMRNPETFVGCPSVSCTSVAVVTIMYAGYGTVGYLAYGTETQGPITDNFATNNYVGMTLKLLISIGLFLSLPIMLFAPLAIVDDYITKKFNIRAIISRWLQIIGIVCIPLIATRIDSILHIMAAPLALLQFVVPLAIDTLLFWESRSNLLRVVTTTRNVVIAMIGISFMFIGIYFGIIDVIGTYQ